MIFIACVVLVAIILVWYYYCKVNFDEYIEGFWMAADDKFCEDAGIDSMLLFLDKADAKGERDGYLIIMNNVASQSLKLSKLKNVGGQVFSARVAFDEEQIWDEDIIIDLDVMKGRLMVLNASKQKKYAVLHKNHELTNSLCLSQ